MATHTSNSRLSPFRRNVCILLSLPALSVSVLYAAESVQFPESFRRWVHVGTGVIMPGGPLPEQEQGMHHVFADQKATDGYSSGDFADGSTIVYELRQSQQKDGVIFEGERRRVDVMIKDSRLYSSTGGWRFERFWGNDQAQNAVSDSGNACFKCHWKAKSHGFVFTQLH
jgi:hypothetical protein